MQTHYFQFQLALPKTGDSFNTEKATDLNNQNLWLSIFASKMFKKAKIIQVIKGVSKISLYHLYKSYLAIK